jgi:SAM-dependent methyltransferase
MTVSGVNFGKAAADYAAFRAGFPDSIFERLASFDVGLPGQDLVDLGTGTGTLARGFARRGCRVVGLDPDARMLAAAQAHDREHGLTIAYVKARAEATGLASASADVVTAGQCWHWFDRPRALDEVVRVLRNSGKLVIAHFDWLPLPRTVVEATEQLIAHHNADWRLGGANGMYPQWLPDLLERGFRNVVDFFYDVDVPYTPAAWRGRIRASAGIAALTVERTGEFDAALARLLAQQFPQETLTVPHRVFAIVAEAPSSAR